MIRLPHREDDRRTAVITLQAIFAVKNMTPNTPMQIAKTSDTTAAESALSRLLPIRTVYANHRSEPTVAIHSTMKLTYARFLARSTARNGSVVSALLSAISDAPFCFLNLRDCPRWPASVAPTLPRPRSRWRASRHHAGFAGPRRLLPRYEYSGRSSNLR